LLAERLALSVLLVVIDQLVGNIDILNVLLIAGASYSCHGSKTL
jgi:hypothetical protein